MNLNQESITVKYLNINEYNTSSQKSGKIIICTEGYCEIKSNSKLITLQKNDTIITNFNSSLSSLPENSRAIILNINEEYIQDNKITNSSEYTNITNNNPIISLSNDEIQCLISLYSNFIPEEQSNNTCEKKLINTINQGISKSIFYKIIFFYSLRHKSLNKNRDRDEIIFDTFIEQINYHCPSERQLKFYSSKLNITPLHLSKVVKRTSNFNASHWIAKTTIYQIKKQLITTQKPIKLIAAEFNFPSPEKFYLYFHKHTNQSPSQFRKQNT